MTVGIIPAGMFRYRLIDLKWPEPMFAGGRRTMIVDLDDLVQVPLDALGSGRIGTVDIDNRTNAIDFDSPPEPTATMLCDLIPSTSTGPSCMTRGISHGYGVFQISSRELTPLPLASRSRPPLTSSSDSDSDLSSDVTVMDIDLETDAVILGLDRHLILGKTFTTPKNSTTHIYNIGGIEKHADDHLSVDTWIQELSSMEDENPVLLYKPQGVEDKNNFPDFLSSDFVLCMQTSTQRQFMLQFGSDNIVCLDSTHGTTQHDFNLITVMVVDDVGEGNPIGFMICNREDKQVLAAFFRAIKA